MPCHEKPLLSTVVLWYWCPNTAQQRNNATTGEEEEGQLAPVEGREAGVAQLRAAATHSARAGLVGELLPRLMLCAKPGATETPRSVRTCAARTLAGFLLQGLVGTWDGGAGIRRLAVEVNGCRSRRYQCR